MVQPSFKPGDRVVVRSTYPLGHIRTPYYIRGQVASIERLCGSFPIPEELAQQRSGLPSQPLSRVRFLQRSGPFRPASRPGISACRSDRMARV